MLVGYARVSTEDQNLDLQRDALNRIGCEKIFEEKESGRSGTKRPAFEAALVYLRPQGKRMKVCDPMAGALSGRSQVRKPCRTRQRAGPQRRLLTYLGHREASCVSPGR